MSVLWLNHVIELRYGAPFEKAHQVFSKQVIPLEMGYLNGIWQADAAVMSLQSLNYASAPPFVINIAGPDLISVRRIAGEFGERFKKPMRSKGKAFQLFAYPQVSLENVLPWIPDWVERGEAALAKPTHFENRAGNF